MKHYLLGYGSLLERASRIRTTPDAIDAFPVLATGFKRGWFARTGVVGLTTTFLGCVHDKADNMNAVVYQVTEEDLKETDKREKGYKRYPVDWDQIADWSGGKIDMQSKLWVYVNDFESDIPAENFPNHDFPIVQSYVDICINGCIEAQTEYPEAKEHDFIATFFKTTQFWNEAWANDRPMPRRPFIYRANAYTIDGFVKEHLPELFDKIYIE